MAVNTFSCNQVGLFNVGNYGHKWLLQELQFLALSPEPIFFFFFFQHQRLLLASKPHTCMTAKPLVYSSNKMHADKQNSGNIL